MTSGLIEPQLSDRLRTETAAVHRAAERSGFIADLIRGRATKDGYVLFVRNLQPVYAAMERRLRSSTSISSLGAFADLRLNRLKSIEHDLAAMDGDAWHHLPVLAATDAYVAAIESAADAGAARLTAHAYARYLGDLSGGQILKPVLARNLQLPLDALTFYDFPEIADIPPMKESLRASLDTIEAQGPEADALCAEAIAAFRHNIAVSEAVQAHLA